MVIKGGCLCGKVRYETREQPGFQFKCHCKDCQRSTGGAYAPIAFFPEDSLVVSGSLTFYSSQGQSGKQISRGFCPVCGSQVLGTVEILPDMIGIRAGTLDCTENFTPKAHIFTSHATAWDMLESGIPAFSEAAPQGSQTRLKS